MKRKLLLAARARLDRANEEVRKLTTQQQDLTLQSGTLATRVQQSERKLYSGKIQSPKELEDLQESIDALKRQRSEIDDDRLMAMMLLEDVTCGTGIGRNRPPKDRSCLECQSSRAACRTKRIGSRVARLDPIAQRTRRFDSIDDIGNLRKNRQAQKRNWYRVSRIQQMHGLPRDSSSQSNPIGSTRHN